MYKKKILLAITLTLILITSTSTITRPLVKAVESVVSPTLASEGFNIQPIQEIIQGSDILIIQDVYTWGMNISPDAAVCDDLGLSYDLITSETFGTMSASTLKSFKAIILTADQPESFYNNLYAQRQRLADYVSNGGMLSAVVYTGWIQYIVTQQFLPGDVILNFWPSQHVGFSSTHYIIANPDRPVSLMGPWGSTTIIDNINYASTYYFTDIPTEAATIATDYQGHSVIIEYPFGKGKILAVGIPIQWFYRYNLGLGGKGCVPPWDGANNLKLLYNEIEYQSLPIYRPNIRQGDILFPPLRGKWILTQTFANYLTEYGGQTYNGYHPGEDWSFKGNTNQGSIYSIYDGKIVKVSDLGQLGYLIAIEHEGVFAIPGKTETVHSETYQYPTEVVTKIYSIYVHVNPVKGIEPNIYVRRGERIATLANITHPHLHFEIRQPDQMPSGNWSLVLPVNNWQVFPDTGKYNGYYIHVQPMVDAGLRSPSDFLEANR